MKDPKEINGDFEKHLRILEIILEFTVRSEPGSGREKVERKLQEGH